MLKGIVLAGGQGTRLYPVTKGVSKQLLPVFDKPMVYYPISTLMLAGIRDILVITTAEDRNAYQRLLGSGSDFGVNLSYAIQDKPDGLAQAFIIGRDFIGSDRVCLILGDNIFYGQDFRPMLIKAGNRKNGATIFGCQVKNPGQFGVVEFDSNDRVLSIEEKPEFPKSHFAVTGLYFYDNDVVEIAQGINPSSRGELEITCVNEVYLKRGDLQVNKLGRGFSWFDAGTQEGLITAARFVETVERQKGYKLACLEEIAFKHGWISKSRLLEISRSFSMNQYGEYLVDLIRESDIEERGICS